MVAKRQKGKAPNQNSVRGADEVAAHAGKGREESERPLGVFLDKDRSAHRNTYGRVPGNVVVTFGGHFHDVRGPAGEKDLTISGSSRPTAKKFIARCCRGGNAKLRHGSNPPLFFVLTIVFATLVGSSFCCLARSFPSRSVVEFYPCMQESRFVFHFVYFLLVLLTSVG